MLKTVRSGAIHSWPYLLVHVLVAALALLKMNDGTSALLKNFSHVRQPQCAPPNLQVDPMPMYWIRSHKGHIRLVHALIAVQIKHIQLPNSLCLKP